MKYPSSRALGIAVAGLAVAGLLVGCSGKLGGSSPEPAPTSTASKITPINLSDTTAISALCGDDANTTYKYVKSAAAAKPTSDKRTALVGWGLTADQVKDTTKLKTVVASLKTRAATSCKDVTNGEKVGVLNHDGTTTVVPIVNAGTSPVIIDSTQNASTPPLIQPQLLDGSLRFTAQTLSWKGLVDRVGEQQWYKDGVNSYAAQTGFSWNDVLKFAAANSVINNKVVGTNALAIQIYNQPGLTDAQARDQVRQYITPAVEKVIGTTVDQLPIQRIDNGFMNTVNAGTAAFPKMQQMFDTEKMVRVTLMPLTFDASGKANGLDGSRGAGIFIDCGNLHWVPQAMWKCTGPSCATLPPCPAGMEGTQPNCHVPPPPVTPPTVTPPCTTCLTPKGPSIDNGWTPLGAGPLTNGKISQEQKSSGQTSGNVTDHQVPSGTTSGSTTSDMGSSNGQTGSSGVTAPGATPGGDSQSSGTPGSAPQDKGNTSSDTGGTSGATCITDPDTGVKSCK